MFLMEEESVCLSSRPPLKLEEQFSLVLALLQLVMEEAGHRCQLGHGLVVPH